MRSMELFLALTFFGVLGSLNADDSDRQVYCGRFLAMRLANLCINGVLVKRSDPFDVMASEKQYEWPWMAPQRANAFGRGKRTITSECCENPCSVEELKGYCRPE